MHVVFSLHKPTLSQNQNDLLSDLSVNSESIAKKTITTVSGGSLGSLVEEERS